MSLEVSVPGWKVLHLEHVLFDLNGTLACEGRIAPTTRERLLALGKQVTLHVMSADTYGTLEREVAGLPLQLHRVEAGLGAAQKLAVLRQLGAAVTAAVGNGHNDVEMLREAALGIVVLGPEGAAVQALLAAHVVFNTPDDALDALLRSRRLVATLRG
jgi:soluble P-type ATPase